MTSAPPPLVLAARRLTEGATGVAFDFGLGDDLFTEQFRFDFPIELARNPDGAMVQQLLDIAHICVGVSYYKLTMPGVIRSIRPLRPEVARLVRHLYDDGLRELAVRNGLDVPLTVTLDSGIHRDPLPHVDIPEQPRQLLPFGGGKDSTLTLSLVDDPTTLAIHPTAVQRRVAKAAGVKLLSVTRTLDPLLARRTDAGGFNGHIPITAINSSIAALVAGLTGFADVIMANERSAEEPTMFVDDTPVNHQYSKTFAFERILAEALRPVGIRYFSMVRRYSELAIAGALAPNKALRREILSCNRAFSLTRSDPNPTWCRNCAKCRFTFLCFAVFLEPSETIDMFGGNMLDDSDQIQGFRALWHEKPFDCVGELAESAIAMSELAKHASWRDMAVVASLASEAATVAERSGTTIDDLLQAMGDDGVPPEYRERIEAVMPTPERLARRAVR